MLLVTGLTSRNMEIALKRNYNATPPPKLVVAVGDCGCNGVIFSEGYAVEKILLTGKVSFAKVVFTKVKY